MDSIIIAARNSPSLDATLKATITAIQQAGLTVTEEKIQQTSPRKYLGLEILSQTVQHQPWQKMRNQKHSTIRKDCYKSLIGLSLC